MNFAATTLFIVLALITQSARAQDSAALKNFHSVDPSGYIYRGAQPGSQTAELKRLKFDHVLIVKKQNKNEVEQEVQKLKAMGVKTDVIPMEWDHPDLKNLCFQIVEAVQLLVKLKHDHQKTYFHCSMGQDRTGTVAGLFRMVDQGWNQSRAFRDEMCAHGYSDGAPGKPAAIVHDIEASLTPVFLTLSKAAAAGELNPSACNQIVKPSSVPTCHQAGSPSSF